jgi:tol-pal system beta propeller repeat protein TolB
MLIPILLLLVLVAGQAAPHVSPPPEPQESAAPAGKTFYQDVAWSRDGRRIAFTAMRRAGEKEMSSGIYVMRADGTEAARVTDDATVAFYVSMSPDGKRVAYACKTGEKKSDIFAAPLDGSSPTRLTQGGYNHTPAWSPDGRRIAFITDRDGAGPQVYVMNSDGSNQTRLTRDDTRDYNPAWSPDGRRITFYAERGDQKDQVWVMNADGREAKLLTGGVGHNIFPAFASDGARVLFTSKREGDSFFHIYSVKTDGTDLKRLCEQEAFFARPSPDGKKIAFTAGRFPESAIYVMNSDGTGVVRLTK